MNFMQRAIELAKNVELDVPVAALVVKDGEIIAKAINEREKSNDISSHAEINAIKLAEKFLGNWRLDGCDLYVTLEPCPMCAWAILQARLNAVYFGSYDCNYGALGSVIDLKKISNSKTKIYGGINEFDCDNIMNDFWKKKRHHE